VAPATLTYTSRATTHMGASILAVALAIALGGCSPKPVAEDQVAAMQAGLDAFYTRHDPQAAVLEFQKVLAANPSQYGATFQLAAALDAAGRSDEARPLWEKMLTLDESSGDQQTAARARAKLSQPPVATEETLMRAGLDALYQRTTPPAAAAEFQRVLAKNPTHYGATFQLAAALDSRPSPDVNVAPATADGDLSRSAARRRGVSSARAASCPPSGTSRGRRLPLPGSADTSGSACCR